MFRVLGDGHMDTSTHRVRIDLVLCEPGTGLRNADLIQSFVEMTRDPHWGVPQTLHLDNGSEYNFADMLGDPLALAGIGCTVKSLTRVRAHNPAAKGLLEGFFRILETMLKPMIGSIPAIAS